MKSDLFVLFPFMYNNDECIANAGTNSKSDIYIEQMNDIMKYEVSENISNDLIRRYLGEYKFKFYENYPSRHCNVLGIIKGNIYTAIEPKANLCICEIFFHFDDASSITYYLDAISKNDVILMKNNFEILFHKYMRKYGLELVGSPKCCTFLSDMPSERELTYLVASEFYDHDDIAFINSPDIDNIIHNNMSQYDFLQCYSSPNSIVHVMRFFEEEFCERIYFEGLSIFVAELVLFNIAALNRTNYKVIHELSTGAEPSLESIQNINLEYAQTITLWNINIFKSTTAQIAAQKFYDAFEVNKLIESYNRNQAMLEHITDIKNAIRDEAQDKIINIAAFILTIIQVCQFVYYMIMSVIKHSNSANEYIVAIGTATSVAIILFAVYRRSKRRKKRLN